MEISEMGQKDAKAAFFLNLIKTVHVRGVSQHHLKWLVAIDDMQTESSGGSGLPFFCDWVVLIPGFPSKCTNVLHEYDTMQAEA